MDIFFDVLGRLLLSVLVALLFGWGIFLFRKRTVKSQIEMNAFLEKRFDVILNSKVLREDGMFIDAILIKKWGRSGWSFVGLAAIAFNFSNDSLCYIGIWLPLILLVFSGVLLGDAKVALHFMQKLGLTKFRVSDSEADYIAKS